MKKFVITLLLAAFTFSMITSCDPDPKDELADEFQIEKEEVEVPSDKGGN